MSQVRTVSPSSRLCGFEEVRMGLMRKAAREFECLAFLELPAKPLVAPVKVFTFFLCRYVGCKVPLTNLYYHGKYHSL